MDNSINRLNDVFFYGLYMDEEILKSKGVIPRNQRIAKVKDYRLRIGKMATLLRDINSEVYGLVYSLTHDEIYKLYEGSNLSNYVAESVVVNIDGVYSSSLCCNLLNSPLEDESNNEYLDKLIFCMNKYNLPLPKNVR